MASSADNAVTGGNTEVNWGPLTTIFITVGLYFGAQILALGLLLLAAAILNWPLNTTIKWLDTSVNARFLVIGLSQLITLGGLWWFIKRRRRDFRVLGLNRFRPRWLMLSAGGYVVYFITLLITLAVLQQLLPGLNLDQKQQLGFESARSAVELTLVFISLAAMPALVEEIMARGFLYHGLRKRWPRWTAVIITSILFALAHLQFGLGAPLLWAAAIDTFILSLVLIALVERSGSLWPAIGLHFIKNSLAFVFLFIVNVK